MDQNAKIRSVFKEALKADFSTLTLIEKTSKKKNKLIFKENDPRDAAYRVMCDRLVGREVPHRRNSFSGLRASVPDR
jgi:hypothetical protein